MPGSRNELNRFSTNFIDVLPAAVYVCNSAAVMSPITSAPQNYGALPVQGRGNRSSQSPLPFRRVPPGTWMSHACAIMTVNLCDNER